MSHASASLGQSGVREGNAKVTKGHCLPRYIKQTVHGKFRARGLQKAGERNHQRLRAIRGSSDVMLCVWLLIG